jgi:hypothetical protein
MVDLPNRLPQTGSLKRAFESWKRTCSACGAYPIEAKNASRVIVAICGGALRVVQKIILRQKAWDEKVDLA